MLDAEVFVGLDVNDEDRARLRGILDRWYGDGTFVHEPWMNRMAAYAHLRLGEYDRVIEIMDRHPQETSASSALAMSVRLRDEGGCALARQPFLEDSGCRVHRRGWMPYPWAVSQVLRFDSVPGFMNTGLFCESLCHAAQRCDSDRRD